MHNFEKLQLFKLEKIVRSIEKETNFDFSCLWSLKAKFFFISKFEQILA
jgi:hypothetical protein